MKSPIILNRRTGSRTRRVLSYSVIPILLTLLCASFANAQISRLNAYTFSTFTGSYSSINGVGNYLTSGDDNTSSFSLPFAFNYDSVNYASGTTVFVCTNGYMSFGSITNYAMGLSGSSSYPNYFAPFNYDGYVRTGIYYYVSGTAPNRVLTVEWKYYTYWTVSSPSFDMQVKFYETSNVIEYLYSAHSSSAYNSGDIGLNGNSSPSFMSYTYSSSTSSTPATDLRWTPRINQLPSRVTASPKSIDYSFVNVGNNASRCVTVTAVTGSGLGPVIVKAVGMSGNPDFALLPGGIKTGDTIQPGNSEQACIQFAPITSGSRSATLTIATNGLDSGTININLTGIGVAPAISIAEPGLFRKSRVKIGDSLTQCFPVQSTGTLGLRIDSVVVVGTNSNQYHVSSLPSVIPAGSTGNICITYAPSYEGRPDAQIVVYSNALNSPRLSFQTFGVGVIPHFSFVMPDSTLSTSATLVFDSVPIGQTVCKNQVITNTGSDTLAILRNYMSSADYDFQLTPLSGTDTLLAPGQSKNVQICFTPLKQGLRVATIRFATNLPRTFPRPGQDTSQFVLSVQGTGVPFGQLSVSGAAIDSGIIGVQTCFFDTIRNTGSADMTVTGWSITGADASEFNVSGVTVPFTLLPGATKVVNVCITPTQRGLRQAAIAVVGSTGGTPVNGTLPLLGYGLEVCASASPTTAFATKPIVIGQSSTATVTVTNCGDVATRYNASVQQAGSDYSVLPAQSAMVQPGSTTQFTVNYTASNIGPSAGTLHITGGTSVTPMDVTLGAVGGGVRASATDVNAGDVMVGSCKDVTMTILNNGNVDWTPGTPTLSNGQYTFVSLNPTTIPAGGSAVLTVKFCPTAQTTSTTTVTFGSPDIAPVGGFTANISGRGIASGVAMKTEADGFILGQNFPNPVAGKTEIRFTTPTDAIVRIELLDLTGQTVQTIEDSRFGAGEHSVLLDVRSLASGTYYYVLSSGSTRLVRQITVTK